MLPTPIKTLEIKYYDNKQKAPGWGLFFLQNKLGKVCRYELGHFKHVDRALAAKYFL